MAKTNFPPSGGYNESRGSFNSRPRIGRCGVGFNLHCCDIGAKCDFVAHGETEEEVLRGIEVHVETFHGIIGFTKIINEQFRKFIREDAPA